MEDPDQEKRVRYLSESNRLLARFVERRCIKSAPFPLPQDGLSSAEVVALFSVAKVYKTPGALLLLVQRKFIEDAAALLRTLFEMALTVRYIAKDETGGRARRFVDYVAVARYEFLKVLRTDPYLEGAWTSVEHDAEALQEIESEARRAQDVWGYWKKDADGKLSSPRDWSGKTTYAMARETGWLSQYDIVFRLTSLMVHPNSHSANDYLRVADGKVVLSLGGDRDTPLIPEQVDVPRYEGD